MSKLTALEQFKLGLAKQQASLKVKIDAENKKISMKTPKVKTKIAKMKTKPKKVKKKVSYPTMKNAGNSNAYIDGRSKDPVHKAKYLKEWRANNPEKQKAYRQAVKDDPVRYAHKLEYDRARPNNAARLEANKIRHRERMLIPIYAEKEKYRAKLRRKSLTDAERVDYQIRFDKAKFQWQKYISEKKSQKGGTNV